MAEFDPYHRWLGIAKDQRPPNHYQLLGVPVGEADPEVIDEAAVRQSAHVRTYQIGQHAADCARILNEIALAKTVLLNPQKKKDYDAKLTALSPVKVQPMDQPPMVQDSRIAAAPLVRAARPVAVPEILPEAAEPEASVPEAQPPWISEPAFTHRPIRREATWLTPGLMIGAVAGGTVLLGLIVLFVVLLSQNTDGRNAGPNPGLPFPGVNDKAAKARKAPVGAKGDPRVEAPGKQNLPPVVDPPVVDPVVGALARDWNQLDTAGFDVEEDFVRVKPGMVCYTKQAYSGPLEITVIARTQQQNIRLHAFKGACVIFNWEGNMNELRVNRPDGNEGRESGSLATAPVEPLAFNSWHTLRWRIDVEGMQVMANNKTVFLERRANDLSDARKVGIGAMTSLVDVRFFEVKALKRALGDP